MERREITRKMEEEKERLMKGIRKEMKEDKKWGRGKMRSEEERSKKEVKERKGGGKALRDSGRREEAIRKEESGVEDRRGREEGRGRLGKKGWKNKRRWMT